MELKIGIDKLKEEIMETQLQQLQELKSQKKQILNLQQNNKRPNQQKQEFLIETKLEHLREELKEEFNNQCKNIQINIRNITKQQGMLQNLVLDIVNQRDPSIDEIESSNKCVICLDKSLSVAIRPCGHVIACFDCAQKLPNECPICRNVILDTLRIYFP